MQNKNISINESLQFGVTKISVMAFTVDVMLLAKDENGL